MGSLEQGRSPADIKEVTTLGIGQGRRKPPDHSPVRSDVFVGTGEKKNQLKAIRCRRGNHALKRYVKTSLGWKKRFYAPDRVEGGKKGVLWTGRPPPHKCVDFGLTLLREKLQALLFAT